jgi:glycosyltransferase involved in cell wall biosynthesis
MRIALVHDYLIQFGGAERVLRVLMNLFPHAPVFTLLHDPRVTAGLLDTSRIRASFLQHVPFARSRHRLFPLVMPLVVERFDLSRYDLIVSASHSFGKGILTRSDTLHLSYCFTPMRYAWDDSHRYVREFGVPEWLRALIPFALTYVRLWDALAADRVDEFVAISRFVAQRIRKYYGRNARVLYPPVECSQFQIESAVTNRFLIVSRLLPYKRIDLAIDAFNTLKLPLDIVGTGPEEERLRDLAGPTIRIHGFLPDATVREMYARCRAFIFPQEEDFGITPLEAAAAGRPVVAYAGGGALETVIDGGTGVFFREQKAEQLAEAVEDLLRRHFDPVEVRQHALQFDTNHFTVGFMKIVRQAWEEFPRKRWSAGVLR